MLKKIFRKIWRTLKNFVTGCFWYFGDMARYRSLLKKTGQSAKMYFFPQIFDRDPASHTFDKHYVYMDRWAFSQLLKNRPAEHIDVGSSIRFVSMATTVCQVKFVDIRPVKTDFENYSAIDGSILDLPFESNSLESLSCLHVAEHIGLGRYGDPLDPLGTKKACEELMRVLRPGGKLYFALPIGRTATYFNAHRVHNPQTILEYFKNLKLVEFAAVGDNGHYKPVANLKDYDTATYACGMFLFTK